MKDATRLTPPVHERNSFFKCKQHTIHDPLGPETTMSFSSLHYVSQITIFFIENKSGRPPVLPDTSISLLVYDLPERRRVGPFIDDTMTP